MAKSMMENLRELQRDHFKTMEKYYLTTKSDIIESESNAGARVIGRKDVEGDYILGIYEMNTMDTLLMFTDLGNYVYVPVYEPVHGSLAALPIAALCGPAGPASNALYTELGRTLPVFDGCCPPSTMPEVFPQPWRGALTEGWGPQAPFPSHSSWPRSLRGHRALPHLILPSG